MNSTAAGLRAATVTALRRLARAHWSALAIVASLAVALGVGSSMLAATVAVFNLRPPYPEPGQLVTGRWLGSQLIRSRTWAPTALGNNLFSGIAVYRSLEETLFTSTVPSRVRVAAVSADFFRILGLRIDNGRPLMASDQAQSGSAGQAKVIVLSDRLWRGKFGSNPALLGQDIRLGSGYYRVIGVAPPKLDLPAGAAGWIPMENPMVTVVQSSSAAGPGIFIVARLRLNVSLAAANAAVAAREMSRSAADASRLRLERLSASLFGATQNLVGLWAVAALFVLAGGWVSAVSVTRLRFAGRGRELWIRSALGSSAVRSRAEVGAELSALALGALAIGQAIHAFVTASIARVAHAPVPSREAEYLGVGLIVLLLWVVGSLIYGQRRAVWAELHLALAAAVVLLTCFAATARGLVAILRADPGLVPGKTLVLTVALPETWGEYWLQHRAAAGGGQGMLTAFAGFQGRESAFFTTVAGQLRKLPGVSAAGVISAPPYSGIRPVVMNLPYADPPAGGQPDPARAMPGTILRSMSSGARAALGMRLLYGRDFRATDDRQAAVAIVNQAVASRFGPGADALGHTVGYPGQHPWRIVGILADIHEVRVQSPVVPTIYVPVRSEPVAAMALIVRSAGETPLSALDRDARRLIGAADSRAIITQDEALTAMLSASSRPVGRAASLLACFAVLALGLMALGIASSALIEVDCRRHELGVRLALGSGRVALAAAFWRRAWRATPVSIAAGLLAAYWLSGALRATIPGVEPVGPACILFGVGAALAIAGAALALPTARSANREPARLLSRQ